MPAPATEVDVVRAEHGRRDRRYPYKGEVRSHETGALIANFELKTDVDEVQRRRILADHRPRLTTKAREVLVCRCSDVFRIAKPVAASSKASRWRRNGRSPRRRRHSPR